MGGKLGIFRDNGRRIGPGVNLKDKDYALLKKLWLEVETNPQKYGRGMYMRFFLQFPQYLKYFIEDKTASTEDSHRINDKFALILSTLGYLIIDFYKKPQKFDRVLDYVAIMHQDMHLKVEDFNNFSYAIVQYLKEIVPDVMTEDCAKIFAEFIADLSHQLVTKMVKGRAAISSEIRDQDRVYYPCRWFNYHREKVSYGHEQSYWIARRKRWETKMQKWETGDVGTESNMYNWLNRSIADEDEEDQSAGSSLLSPTIESLVRGSVMSEVLHDKLYNLNKEVIFKSGILQSRSSQMLRDVDRHSTAAAIILAGLEEIPENQSSHLSPRERFRIRHSKILVKDSQNDASTSNNQETAADRAREKNENEELVSTRIITRQRRRGSSDELSEDKTDH